MLINCKQKIMKKLACLIAIYITFITHLYPVGGTGGQPGQFLQWAAGARALGLGKAYFSISDDASATYWNPAGLTQLDRKEIMALHAELYPGTKTQYEFISFVYPTPKHGVFGGNIVRLYSPDFQKIELPFDADTGMITGPPKVTGTFSDDNMALTASYGRKVVSNVSIGLALKFIKRKLDIYEDTMVTFDATTLVEGFNSHLPGLKAAFGVKNLISMANGTDDRLPIIFRFGVSHKFLRDRLLTSFDLEKNLKGPMNWSLGVEYWVVNFVAMRIGFDGESGFRESNMGLGFKYKDYGIDYAFAMHDLGESQRVSGSWRFGKSIIRNREALMQRLLQEGMDATRRGKFLIAFNRFDQAYSVDPTNKSVRDIMSKLQKVIGYVQSVTGATDEANSVRKGVSAYLENEIPATVNSFRYAYYKNPENDKLLALLNQIERENSMPLTETFRTDVVGWTIIDQKVYESRQSIIEGRYADALRKSQEIINLEPQNITALELMGSAFYMMDQPDKAREVWLKVMEIDPTNLIVPQFMEQMK